MATSSGQKHTADAVVLMCMDFRIHPTLGAALLKEFGIETYDVLAYPGASKSLVSEETAAYVPLFKKAVAVALELHEVQRLVIADHENCGAYKDLIQQNPEVPEKELHAENFSNAKQFLVKELGMPVEGAYAKLDGTLETY